MKILLISKYNYLSIPNCHNHMVNIVHQNWCVVRPASTSLTRSSVGASWGYSWTSSAAWSTCSTSSVTSAASCCLCVDVMGLYRWGPSSTSQLTSLPNVLTITLSKVWPRIRERGLNRISPFMRGIVVWGSCPQHRTQKQP